VFPAQETPMRLLFLFAGVILLQGSAFAAQKQLTFSMLDIDIEVRKGTSHLVDVSLDAEGRLRMQDHGLIPTSNGGYTGVVRETLDDGAITAVFHIRQDGQDYAGDYVIVGGSGAYAGARGQGSLATLKGREAAASANGIYRARLEVTTPDHRIAADE
jgi:hypothetical protein